jgi:NAD(P)-dependent dehydrogenase (short-subunit alcohol dehydrogenase family)
LLVLYIDFIVHSPGAIYTPIQVDTRDAQQMAGWGHNLGLGRPGEPSEIATSFVFLASADATLYCEWPTSLCANIISRQANLASN